MRGGDLGRERLERGLGSPRVVEGQAPDGAPVVVLGPAANCARSGWLYQAGVDEPLAGADLSALPRSIAVES